MSPFYSAVEQRYWRCAQRDPKPIHTGDDRVQIITNRIRLNYCMQSNSEWMKCMLCHCQNQNLNWWNLWYTYFVWNPWFVPSIFFSLEASIKNYHLSVVLLSVICIQLCQERTQFRPRPAATDDKYYINEFSYRKRICIFPVFYAKRSLFGFGTARRRRRCHGHKKIRASSKNLNKSRDCLTRMLIECTENYDHRL